MASPLNFQELPPPMMRNTLKSLNNRLNIIEKKELIDYLPEISNHLITPTTFTHLSEKAN